MGFLKGIFRLMETGDLVFVKRSSTVCIDRFRQKRGVLVSCEKACDVLVSHVCSTYRYLSPAVVSGWLGFAYDWLVHSLIWSN